MKSRTNASDSPSSTKKKIFSSAEVHGSPSDHSDGFDQTPGKGRRKLSALGLLFHRSPSNSSASSPTSTSEDLSAMSVAEKAPSTKPSGPLEVLDPICKVRSRKNVRLKMKGFLRVSEGEVLTLMETKNLPVTQVVCQQGTEQGRLPANLVYLSHHLWNFHLELVDVMLDNVPLLERVVRECCSSDLVDVLASQLRLDDALFKLCEAEVLDKRERGLETETFRSQTPGMMLVGAIFGTKEMRDACAQFAQFVAERIKAMLPWSLEQLGDVLTATFEQLEKDFGHASPQMAVVVQTLQRLTVVTGQDDDRLVPSVFFLRFLCPCLVQPSNNTSPAVMSGLKDVAKAIQLIANHTDATEGSAMYSQREVLAPFVGRMTHLFNTVVPEVELKVQRQLEEPALDLYRFVYDKCPEFNNDERLAALKQRLGPPDDPPQALLLEKARVRAKITKLLEHK